MSEETRPMLRTPPSSGAISGAPVDVRGNASSGRSVVATRPITAGDVLAHLDNAHRTTERSRYTVQVGPDEHVDGLWQFTFLNHSCAPNVHIDTPSLTIVAVRDIAAGEELGYFYPSTEWTMAEPFTCHCGAPACVGWVSGARDMDAAALGGFRLNPHITELLRGLPD